MRLKNSICFLIAVSSFISFSQDTYYYDQTGKEYKITAASSNEIIEKYLEQNSLDAIEFNPEK